MTRNRSRRIAALSTVLALGATAASPDAPSAVVATLAAQDAAVATVGDRLRIAALPLCRDRGFATGLVVQARSQYGVDYRAAASQLLGLGDRPGVVFVVPGSPAERAGVRRGDTVVSIDGATTAENRAAAPFTIADTTAALDLLDTALRDGAVDLAIRRSGTDSRTVHIAGIPACRARFEVQAGTEENASAETGRVMVSSELVDPDRQDTQLAPLVAHELAHVILGHPDKLRDKYRGALPGFSRAGRALRASEIAADRLSVYLLARAGYREADAITFWTEFGRRTDFGILSDRTHPSWRRRVEAVQSEVARVARLRAAGQPILPPTDLMTLPSG